MADWQNSQRAGIAINALLQLYNGSAKPALDPESNPHLQDLYRKILVFAISHTTDSVTIGGHYALHENGKTTFNRFCVAQIFLSGDDGQERWKSYKFVRSLYDSFVPNHVKRIKDGIARLSDTPLEPTDELPDAQRPVAGVGSVPGSAMIRSGSSQVQSRQSELSATACAMRELEEEKLETEKYKNSTDILEREIARLNRESRNQTRDVEQQMHEAEQQKHEAEQQRCEAEQHKYEAEQHKREAEQHKRERKQVKQQQEETKAELARMRLQIAQLLERSGTPSPKR